MPDSQAEPKIFTLEEANALLPQVRQGLAQVRRHVTLVLTQEAAVDVLEILTDSPEAKAKLTQELELLEQRRSALEAAFAEFEQLGCHLKDLDLGLVDFHAWINGELALLCWHEDEDEIRYWHTPEDGYAGRQPIPGTFGGTS